MEHAEPLISQEFTEKDSKLEFPINERFFEFIPNWQEWGRFILETVFIFEIEFCPEYWWAFFLSKRRTQLCKNEK